MNPRAQHGIQANIAFSATAPALQPAAIAVLATGIVLLLAGTLLIVFAARPRRL
jgi:hypothetical protein